LIDSGVASAEVVKHELDRINLTYQQVCSRTSGFLCIRYTCKIQEIAELFLSKPVNHVHKIDLEELLV
jgi:hypothetical protein